MSLKLGIIETSNRVVYTSMKLASSSSIHIRASLGYGFEVPGVTAWQGQESSLPLGVRTVSGAHPAYSVDTGVFPRFKATEA